MLDIYSYTHYGWRCRYCGQWDNGFRTDEGAIHALNIHYREECPDCTEED